MVFVSMKEIWAKYLNILIKQENSCPLLNPALCSLFLDLSDWFPSNRWCFCLQENFKIVHLLDNLVAVDCLQKTFSAKEKPYRQKVKHGHSEFGLCPGPHGVRPSGACSKSVWVECDGTVDPLTAETVSLIIAETTGLITAQTVGLVTVDQSIVTVFLVYAYRSRLRFQESKKAASTHGSLSKYDSQASWKWCKT